MYHGPKMCRTCLQMSRGDFKFVSLDSVDPLWESNSPNLKAQLMSLVPEMKIEDSNAIICTSCFIALRTAFEFKRMCQATEKKFQSFNYKYRRPFGVGPGSPQFHVTLNENRGPPQVYPANINNNNIYHSQRLNYLQADTSIDITEHHLYDASRSIQRRVVLVTNAPKKPPEVNTVLQVQNINVPKKSLNSQELKEKFNLGSQISILKTERSKPLVAKINNNDQLIKLACETIPYLKENNLGVDKLNCKVRIQVLTHDFVRANTAEGFSLDELKQVSYSYYFKKLEELLTCQFCAKTFSKRFTFQLHQLDEHADKIAPKKEENVNAIETPTLLRKLIAVKNKIVKFRLHKYNKCFICDKMCVSRLHVLQHCKFTHVPRTTCKRKLFKKVVKAEVETLYLRKLRVRTGHAFVSSLRCSICDKGFVNQNELDVHMYVHTPVVLSTDDPNDPKDEESECQFTCYLCGKSFLKERFLKLHNVQMHLRNKPTTCKNCGRVFKSEFWYERHRCAMPVEETTPDEVPDDTNMYPCSFCDRKFSQLRFMKVHRRRSHKHLMGNRGPKDKESAESPILDSTKDSDPMEMYAIAGTSSFADEVAEGEGDSESDAFSEVEQMEDDDDDEEEEYVVEAKPIAQTNVIVPKTELIKPEPPPEVVASLPPPSEPVVVRRGRPSLVKDIKPLTEMPELELGPGRRGNRSLPKIQCDFCGELLEENRYDKHIAEHNKSRLQRRISTTNTHIEEYDSDDFPLKCPVCYKGFKRKYYYNTHINKHIEEGIDVQEEPASPTNDNPATPTPSQPPPEPQPETEWEDDDASNESFNSETENLQLEEDDIQGKEIILEDSSRLYVCCGRSFKLKAHFFRHYKIKHPNNVNKKNPIVYADLFEALPVTIQTEIEPTKPVSNLIDKVQSFPDLTIVQTFPDPKKIVEVKKPEPVEPAIKTEPAIPNDLEIGLKEEMELNKAKRKLSEVENVTVKKLKTENPEAVKLRNTVAAHLDDIEIVAVSPTPSLKHECTQCDKKFKQKSQLRDHQNVHSGDKPYMCEFCDPPHGFTQSSSLYFHIRKVHTGVMKNVSWAIQAKNGLCLVCLEVFEKHMTMYTHLRQNYVENGFNCEMCSKVVTMTCHYKVHNVDPSDTESFMIPQHNLEVVLTEETESRTSSRASTVEDPEDVNEADVIMSKARRCEPCGKMFKTVQYYNMHARGLVHKQRAKLYAKGGKTEVEETVETPTEEPANEEPANEEPPNEEPPKEEAENDTAEIKNTDIETIKEIEDNCKAITKKIQRIGTFKCPKCDATYITKTHLRKHRRTAHRVVYAMHAKRRRKTLNEDAENNHEEAENALESSVDNSQDEQNLSVTNEGDTLTEEPNLDDVEMTPITDEINEDTVKEDVTDKDTKKDETSPSIFNGDETMAVDEDEPNKILETVQPTENEQVPDTKQPEATNELSSNSESHNAELLSEMQVEEALPDEQNVALSDFEDEEMPPLHLDEDIIPNNLTNESKDLQNQPIDELLQSPSLIETAVTKPDSPVPQRSTIPTQVETNEQTPNSKDVSQEPPNLFKIGSSKSLELLNTPDLTEPLKTSIPIAFSQEPPSLVEIGSGKPVNPTEEPPKTNNSTHEPPKPLNFLQEPPSLVEIASGKPLEPSPKTPVGTTNPSFPLIIMNQVEQLNEPEKTTATFVGSISVKKVSDINKGSMDYVDQRGKTNFLSAALAVSNQNDQYVHSSGVLQQMITPPVTQHMYSNPHPLDNRGNLHLSPKYYRNDQFIPPPLHYPPRMERRLSQTFPDYQSIQPQNYFGHQLQPQSHSAYMQSPRAIHSPRESQSNNYGPFFEQGFVIQDDEVMDKSLSQSEPDTNPEQELLALLHNSTNSMYEMKKCDAAFDSEQEFIDLESADPKLLRQSLERLNKSDDAVVNADSSKPDSLDLLYGTNITSNQNVGCVHSNEPVDFQGGLPVSHTVLNEMTHNFR